MASNIDKRTHKLWQGLAIVAGLFLVIEGIWAIHTYGLDSWTLHTFRLVRIAIGAATIIVDGWFLRHI